MVHARTQGVFPPLRPADEVRALRMSAQQRDLFDEVCRGQVRGTEEQVAAALDALCRDTGADELLVSLHTYAPEQRSDSYRRLEHLAAVGASVRPGRA